MNFLNKFKYSRDSYLISFLIIAIIVMINFIAHNHFVRVDLTKNQLYAISDTSKEIVKNLDDIVQIKVYFSDELPNNLLTVRQYIGDILDEFNSYSNGNLKIEFLNSNDDKFKDGVKKYGIPEIQMNIVEKDKMVVKNGYLGVAVVYGDKFETIPVVQNLLNIEYNLISGIKKVTSDRTYNIAFVSGHNEPILDRKVALEQGQNSISLLVDNLKKNYNVSSVDLTTQDVDLSSIDTLFLVGPKENLKDDEIEKIDSFVHNGGNLIVFADAIDINSDFQAIPMDLNINDLLNKYGINIEKQFILDSINEMATFNQGFMNFILNYPLWVKAVNENFNQNNPIVTKLSSISFPWVSSFTLSDVDGIKQNILVNSSNKAWLENEPFNINPNEIQNVLDKKQYPLAVLLNTSFNKEDVKVDEKKSEKNTEEKLNQNTTNSNILFVPNSRFITNTYLNKFRNNLVFVMNAVDFVTLDDSLIDIRSKVNMDFPLKDISYKIRSLVKFIAVFLMPILLIVFGVLRYYFRKNKKIIL